MTMFSCRSYIQDTNHSKPLKPTLARLNEHLLNGYKKSMRPVYDWRKTTIVQIDMVVYAILGVSEKDQLLKSYMWLKQSWKDEFLTWDPKDYDNVKKITIPGQLIWIPDIIVLEFVEATRSPETPYVYVHNTGRVVNPKPLLITTTCRLNIFYFPFDTQRCSVSFTSWLHDGHGIQFGQLGVSKVKSSKANESRRGTVFIRACNLSSFLIVMASVVKCR
ncbi:5-hydroxytryptamine receptor 3A-like [Eleutherodactylus coqui]|uniref:5-hydroxytryptamine receptor 3A-like n=1 Tax=Eleutherodactylus coqui TaxID=57060 RepID=UPI0034624AC4